MNVHAEVSESAARQIDMLTLRSQNQVEATGQADCYLRRPSARSGKLVELEPNREEEAIRRMTELRVDGYSFGAVTAMLTDEGQPTRSGAK